MPGCPRTHTFGVNTAPGVVGVITVSLRESRMLTHVQSLPRVVPGSVQGDAGAVEADLQTGIGGLDVSELEAGGQEIEVDDDV